MSEVTTSALRGMNQGAENLIIATDDFSKAGQSVAGVLHEATGVATKLSLSADAVSISTRAMETIVGDYRYGPATTERHGPSAERHG